MQTLQNVRHLLIEAENRLAALSLLMLLVLALAQIIARNFFDTGLPAVDTLTRYLVLYVMFFGAVIAVERGRHIKIDAGNALLPDIWVQRLYRPMCVIAAAVCCLLSVAAIHFWRDEWAYADGYEQWQTLVGLIIPAGFVLLTLHFAFSALLGPNSETGEM